MKASTLPKISIEVLEYLLGEDGMTRSVTLKRETTLSGFITYRVGTGPWRSTLEDAILAAHTG